MVASNVRLFPSELLHFVFSGFFFVNKDFFNCCAVGKIQQFQEV